MYYELYIDIFFLVNFLMDICILSVAKKILKCPATCRNIFAGALTGSILTCVIVMIPFSYSLLKFGLFHAVVVVFMIKTGLRMKWNRGFVKAYVVVYISTFLFGGIFSSFSQYIWKSCCFLLCALISYFTALKAWNFLMVLGKQNSISCDVLLVQGDNQVKIHALMDTGNRLRDYVTGKPVSVISRQTANRLWQEIPMEGIRYIPYHTIGKKEGVLPVFTLDKMCLFQEEEVWITQVLIAVCEENIGTAGDEMILNPDVK